MRQMPAGQWLPFEGYDVVHVCGATSPNNPQRSHHENTFTKPQGIRANDTGGDDGLGFLDFDLPGQAGAERPNERQRTTSPRKVGKRSAKAADPITAKPTTVHFSTPVLQPSATKSNSASKRTVWVVFLVAILALMATYLVLHRRAAVKNSSTSPSPSEPATKAISPSEAKPLTAGEYYQQGLELTKAKKYNEATEAYLKAIGQDSRMAEAHHELGYAYMQTRQWDKAVSSLKQAVALKPDFAESHRLLGDALSKLEQWEDATESYKQVIRMQPNSALAFMGLGAAYKKLGRSEEAVTAYRRATELKPSNATAHYELGVIYLDLADLDAAQAECDLLLPLNPKLAKSLQEAISGY
jgi:tetratricopeptide (TPR) repeat protein